MILVPSVFSSGPVDLSFVPSSSPRGVSEDSQYWRSVNRLRKAGFRDVYYEECRDGESDGNGLLEFGFSGKEVLCLSEDGEDHFCFFVQVDGETDYETVVSFKTLDEAVNHALEYVVGTSEVPDEM